MYAVVLMNVLLESFILAGYKNDQFKYNGPSLVELHAMLANYSKGRAGTDNYHVSMV